jgi:anti-sigma factor RsiW
MNCTEARELLLEAELAELRGEGESEVARHIRECARCQAMAQEIVEQERSLAQALAGVRPQVSADAAAAEAVAAKVLPLRPRWKRRWAVIPAALAATLAGILLTSNGTPPADVTSTTDVAAVAAVPVVDATSSETFVVFNTDNPDIVVVWLY